MDKIIFFDIDKTLFDREKYLGDFFNLLASEYNFSQEEVDGVGDFYRQIKEEYGYFSNEAFLARIYEKYPNLSEKLNYYFLPENLDDFLFEDCVILNDLKDVRLGIFSKGDISLQKAKIKKIEHLLDPDLIYIYHNKLEKLPFILEEHKDYNLTFVDDNVAILINAKQMNSEVRTILIDRVNEFENVNKIDFKLSSLSDIIPILNE